MEEKLLWKTIEDVNWKKDHNYNRIKEELLLIEPNTLNQLKQFVHKKAKELNKKYQQTWLGTDGGPGINVGDDSWNDLIYDIVGRGEKFYNSITEDKLREIGNSLDFEESFCYSFL